jgi:hypothetical protein
MPGFLTGDWILKEFPFAPDIDLAPSDRSSSNVSAFG